MPPSEDAQLLLRIVQRHLRTLEFGLDERFPAEDWGFTAQQAVEKLLKCWIVLVDEEPPRSHELSELSSLAKCAVPNILLDLQPFAVEARNRDGDFPLPAERSTILEGIQQLGEAFQNAIDGNEAISE